MRVCERGAAEEEALRAVRPGPRERRLVEEAVREAVRAAEEALSRLGLGGYVVRVEGSVAKDTWLSGEADVDVFVLFDPGVCRSVLGGFAALVAAALRSAGYRVEVRYAQHPYVRFLTRRGLWAELVPGCRVERGPDARTAVDRTPFHTEYVSSRLSEEQRDEVRLLKSFMKGVGVYGAEAAVHGFSGYLAELLIIKYGCFRSVLRAAARWRPPVVVAVEPGLEEAARSLLSRYPDAAMVVPDPVDPRRNAAAAVSARSLALFVVAARRYLPAPCAPAFFHRLQPPPPTPRPVDWGPRLESTAAVELELRPGQAPETYWGVAERLAKLLARWLASRGFTVARRSHYIDEERLRGYIVVEATPPRLPAMAHRRGPPAWASEARVEGFLEAHLERGEPTWVDEDGSLAALTERRGPRRLCEAVAEALRGGMQLPRSARGSVESTAVRCGAEAAWAIAAAGGRWAWEQATGTPYWMWLHARLCGRR